MNLKEIINGNYVKNIIKNITGEYNEDLEQEACVKIWKNSEKYQRTGQSKSLGKDGDSQRNKRLP